MSEPIHASATTAAPTSTPIGTHLPAGPSTVGSALAPVTPVVHRLVKRRPTRVKAPKDSKVYKAAIATIALKAQGLKYTEISEQLGLSVESLKTYIKRSAAKGWINLHSFDDPEDRLEHVLKHKTVENLNKILNESQGDDQTNNPSNRALEVSLEIAKGTGLLKQHQVVKTDGQTSVGFALKVQVEMPPSQGPVPTVRVGHIGGTPAINAEVIESPE